MIITHRGHYKNQKENTIAAFEAALKAGADAVECDLKLTQDNQVVIYHDNKLSINGKSFNISQTSLKDLTNIKSASRRHSGLSRISQYLEQKRFWSRSAPQNDEREAVRKLLTIDELFEYIKQKRVPFFLEVKNSSAILVEKIAKKINDKNLWEQVHIIGFSPFIKNALRAQIKYPKLRVLPIVNFPLLSYVRIPPKSYGLFIGWIDQWYGSKWIFRKLISPNRLRLLRNFFEKNGFKVMAGVINNESGFKYFEEAGITDIVTDNINDAVDHFKKH